MVIRIDPQIYYDSAKQLRTLASEVHRVATALATGLGATAGMGGSDPATAWNNAYRQHANDIVDTVIAYSTAIARFADVLDVCGWNWDTAEYNANISKNKGPAPGKPQLGKAPTVGVADLPHVPDPNAGSAIGLTIDPLMANPLLTMSSPLGSLHMPSGNTDLLDGATTAWTVFANSGPMNTDSTPQRINDAFGVISAPEVSDINQFLAYLEQGQTAIWNAASGLAKAVRVYHDELIAFRSGLAAAAPDVFPHHHVSTATISSQVQMTVVGDVSTDEIGTAVTKLDDVYSGHSLAGLLRTPTFDGTDELGIISQLRTIGEIALPAESGNQADNAGIDRSFDNISTWNAAPTQLSAVDPSKLDPSMRTWVESAVKYGNQAGVDPRLVMAVVLNEGATRNQVLGGVDNTGYDAVRYLGSPFRNNSLGLTNMKEDTFNSVKQAFPDQFKNDDWHDLTGNNDLAVKASTYRLKQIQDNYAGRVPDDMRAKYSFNQFMTAGYNAGDGAMSGIYIPKGSIGPDGLAYSNRILSRFDQAQSIMCGSGAYICR
ncbi:hypothetical protein [Nocardia alni]|uniref:hypothetical protein n=1 Tax=Nocardia alni TaxID=2815723 RepID=UPI001C22BA56|nr:hypothetical protein [Nocardia alni]